jgi:hypothetical protein
MVPDSAEEPPKSTQPIRGLSNGPPSPNSNTGRSRRVCTKPGNSVCSGRIGSVPGGWSAPSGSGSQGTLVRVTQWNPPWGRKRKEVNMAPGTTHRAIGTGSPPPTFIVKGYDPCKYDTFYCSRCRTCYNPMCRLPFSFLSPLPFPLLSLPLFLCFHCIYLSSDLLSAYLLTCFLLAAFYYLPTLLCTHLLTPLISATYPVVHASPHRPLIYHCTFSARIIVSVTCVSPCSLCLSHSINTGHFSCSTVDSTS